MKEYYITKLEKSIEFDDLFNTISSNEKSAQSTVELEVEFLTRIKERELVRKKRNHRRQFLLYLKNQIGILVAGLLLVMLINTYWVELVEVKGASMEPTLSAGDYKFMYKKAYNNSEPSRFDVITFELIEDSEHYYIKRVIGLPGERVRIEHGSIFINDDYLLDVVTAPVFEALSANVDILLAEDEYFVLGDNRSESLDSRDKNFGNVKKELILGQINIIN